MNEKPYIGKIFLCFLITFSMIVGSYLILLSSEIESDESTDIEEKAIVLGGSGHPSQGGGKKDPADLKITDIFTIPSSPVGGESVTIYAKIENIGDLDVKVPFTSYLDIDGYWAATKYLDELVGGGSAYITKTVTLDSGYHELDAIADYWDDAKEADEGNNQRIENILWAYTQDYPDLTVISLSSVDIWGATTSATSGQPFQVTATVKNIGSASAGASTFELRDVYDTSSTVLATMSVPSLVPQETYTQTFVDLYISQDGSHTLRGVADSSNALVEENENNNEYDKSFQVNLASWTVAIYMDGDSEALDGGQMDPWAIGDITEMRYAGSSSQLNIVVLLDLYDGETGYQWSTTKQILILPNNVKYLGDLGEKNMGDPQTLSDFRIWAFERFKSTYQALFLWGHGAGCIGGIFEDQNIGGSTEDNYMTADELDDALGGWPDIIAFHACLMGNLEIFWEIGFSAGDIVIASAEALHTDGYPYGAPAPYTDGILNYLRNNPTTTPVAWADLIVDYTYNSYNGGSQQWSGIEDDYLTIGAYYRKIDLGPSNLGYVANEMYDFAYQLWTHMPRAEISHVRNYCERYADPGLLPSNEFTNLYVDLYDFAKRIEYMTAVPDIEYTANDLRNEILDATINFKGAIEHQYAMGISIYFPKDSYVADTHKSLYDSLGMSFTFCWDEFILDYYNLELD